MQISIIKVHVSFYSLPKKFLYSFGFFLAVWSRRERVGAVTVGWALRQSGQIQMVSALSLSFSCTTKCPQIIISNISVSVADT